MKLKALEKALTCHYEDAANCQFCDVGTAREELVLAEKVIQAAERIPWSPTLPTANDYLYLHINDAARLHNALAALRFFVGDTTEPQA